MKKMYAKAEMNVVMMEIDDIIATSVSVKAFDELSEDNAAFGDLFGNS